MKLLKAPPSKPINKDAVIDDLKRKLDAMEYQRDLYKNLYEESVKKEYDHWLMTSEK